MSASDAGGAQAGQVERVSARGWVAAGWGTTVVKVYDRNNRQARIHPDADVHPTAVIGEMPESRNLVDHLTRKADWRVSLSYGAWFDAVIGPEARIGPFVTVDGGTVQETKVDGWVFAHAHVGHDCVVERGAEVSSGAVLGGHTHVGEGARVGIGAVTRPYASLGKNSRLGCGSVLLTHIPDGETWAGVPARKVEKEHLKPVGAGIAGAVALTERLAS